MKELSNYERFQLEKYGNILPEYKNPYFTALNEETENGSYQREEENRRFEQQEEQSHNANES